MPAYFLSELELPSARHQDMVRGRGRGGGTGKGRIFAGGSWVFKANIRFFEIKKHCNMDIKKANKNMKFSPYEV